MSDSDERITREALNRLETNAKDRLQALRELVFSILEDHDRRILDVNNSHEKATEEKRRTDEAATRVQERAVTKADLQVWKDEVNRRLDVMSGAASANAKVWSVAMGIAVLILNLMLRYLFPAVGR